jgi:hypothetical protein
MWEKAETEVKTLKYGALTAEEFLLEKQHPTKEL